MESEETNNLKLLGVKSLRSFGFVNVTTENIMADEVYRFFFGRFLVSKKGSNKRLNNKIEELLNKITESA